MLNKFNAIDMRAWPRTQTYHYFTEVMPPLTYSINVSMDVTMLRKILKQENIKFFPVYLYLVSKAIEKQKELRLVLKDGVLGYWDFLTPQYPIFHEDDKTVTLLWTEYDNDFKVFYKMYMDDYALYGSEHGIISSKGAPPEYNFIISCVPWFTFNSFSMYLKGADNYFLPSIESGGFVELSPIISMPLAITINHAAADGYQIKLFIDDLQWTMNNPKEWL